MPWPYSCEVASTKAWGSTRGPVTSESYQGRLPTDIMVAELAANDGRHVTIVLLCSDGEQARQDRGTVLRGGIARLEYSRRIRSHESSARTVMGKLQDFRRRPNAGTNGRRSLSSRAYGCGRSTTLDRNPLYFLA